MRPAATLLITMAFLALGAAKPQSTSSEGARFQRWLGHYLKHGRYFVDDNDLQNLVYGYSLVDLNADGKNEAVVWTRDANWCGSSGCVVHIFVHAKSGWRYFCDGVNTRLPIKLLPTRTHGWRDLSGWQYGGGVQHPFESWIRFDGRSYGWSETGWKVPRRVHGRIIIKDATVPLFPGKCRQVTEAPSVFGAMRIETAKPRSC